MKDKIHNLTAKPITEFTRRDTVYANRNIRGFMYTVLGKFVKFERGCVTVKGKFISPEWADAREFGGTTREGDATITVKLTKCYLWGQGPEDVWPRCHWFKTCSKTAD